MAGAALARKFTSSFVNEDGLVPVGIVVLLFRNDVGKSTDGAVGDSSCSGTGEPNKEALSVITYTAPAEFERVSKKYFI